MDADEREIYVYLKAWRHEFLSAREICRRAGGKRRFQEDENWAKPVLQRMVVRGILETDPAGYYRLKPREDRSGNKSKKWVSPQMERILTQSGKDFTHVITTEDEEDKFYDSL